MPRFNKTEIHKVYDDMVVLMAKVEELDGEIPKSTGEVKSAFQLVRKQFLCDIQRKIGEMWYIIGNTDDYNPFEMVEEEVKQSE